MRDYDDHVRPHVVLRRIIIVVAVLTAVPVALWTVTGLIRTYVGPPKVPSFRQLATSVNGQQENTTASGAAGDWSLWQSVTTFARVHVGALPIPSIRQLTATITGNANAGPEASDRSSPSAERAQPSAASPMTVEARATATDARDPSASPKDQLASDPKMPANAAKLTDASPAPMSANSADVPVILPAGNRSADFSTASVSTSSTQPDPAAPNVWPSPSRQNSASRAAAPWPAAPQTDAMQEAARQNATDQAAAAVEPPADAVPAGQPLTGPIPLPRHRPSDLAMMQITAANVPMPRPRPDIEATTSPTETTTSTPTKGPLNFLNGLFHSE